MTTPMPPQAPRTLPSNTQPRPVTSSAATRPQRLHRRLVLPLARLRGIPERGGHSPFALLRRRIVLTNVVVVAVVLAALCSSIYIYEAHAGLAQVDQQVATEAHSEAAKGLPQPATAGEEAESPYQPGSPNLFSIVVAQPRRVVQDDDHVAQIGLPDWNAAQPVLQGTQRNTTVTTVRDNASYRLYTVPIRSGSSVVGAVQAGTSLATYEHHLRSLLAILAVLSLSVLLLTTVLSILLAERALTPARQAFARQRQFAAAASHELRTPLAFIRSQAELIVSAEHDSTAIHEMRADAREIITEVDYLTRVTRDLLLLARDEHDTRTLLLKPVDLEAIVREASVTALPQAAKRTVQLVADGNLSKHHVSDRSVVQGDPDRLRQLVLILLDNAIRYTPPHGTITLNVRADHRMRLGTLPTGAAVLTVSDTGVGIAPTEQPRIFEPFYRATRDGSNGRIEGDNAIGGDGGTGLGLALAQWIVHAHGGTITAQSALGKGTTFTVTLPLSGERDGVTQV